MPRQLLFVSECQINTIMRYDSSGNGAVFADASDGLIEPAGIKCDGRGNLYVAENMKVLKFDPNGSVSRFGPNFGRLKHVLHLIRLATSMLVGVLGAKCGEWIRMEIRLNSYPPI